ncbi:MAG: hypothetical protein JW810_03940 [Sedimentisphaerales bacterium]|nr:hypothetical protein [Sedimentisphaerales bacterium]
MNRHLSAHLLTMGIVLLSAICLQARPQEVFAQEITLTQTAEPTAGASEATLTNELELTTERVVVKPEAGNVATSSSVAIQTKSSNVSENGPVSVSAGLSSGSSGGMGGGMGGAVYGSSSVQSSSNDLSVLLKTMSRSPEAIIVLPGGHSAETRNSLREDMTIMTRILNERVQPESQPQSYGGFFIGSHSHRLMMGNRELDGLYLPDYGALFWMYVSMPLAPPAPEAAPDEQEAVDPVWNRTKQQLLMSGQTGEAFLSTMEPQPITPYDQEKVDALLDRLLQTLKHAGNIRAIPPAEWITVVIVGYGQDAQVKTAVSVSEGRRTSTKSVGPFLVKSDAAALITVRARKADIDAYAQGTMDFEQFQKTVQIHRSRDEAPEPADQ